MKRKRNNAFKTLGLAMGMGLSLWLCATPAFSQPTTVGLRMDVDKREVEVGDKVTVSLEFKQVGSGNSSVIQEPSIPTPEHFEIRGTSSATQVTIINQQTAEVSTTRLTLVATQSGTEVLGPALLIYQDSQGKKREIKSNVATVTVVEKKSFSLFGKKKEQSPSNPAMPQASGNTPPGSTPSENDLQPIKPLLPESFFVIRLIICLAILALIAGFVWRQMNKPTRKMVSFEPLTKAAQLRDAWKKLSNEDLDSKEFCLGLASLMRECLEYRFQFPAVDFTTEEILKALGEYKLSKDEREAVEKCLKACDRVLYADGNLTGRDNLRALCSALLPKAQKQ
ncbi:MAG TPA: BatD family protein [bacterium]